MPFSLDKFKIAGICTQRSGISACLFDCEMGPGRDGASRWLDNLGLLPSAIIFSVSVASTTLSCANTPTAIVMRFLVGSRFACSSKEDSGLGGLIIADPLWKQK